MHETNIRFLYFPPFQHFVDEENIRFALKQGGTAYVLYILHDIYNISFFCQLNSLLSKLFFSNKHNCNIFSILKWNIFCFSLNNFTSPQVSLVFCLIVFSRSFQAQILYFFLSSRKLPITVQQPLFISWALISVHCRLFTPFYSFLPERFSLLWLVLSPAIRCISFKF